MVNPLVLLGLGALVVAGSDTGPPTRRKKGRRALTLPPNGRKPDASAPAPKPSAARPDNPFVGTSFESGEVNMDSPVGPTQKVIAVQVAELGTVDVDFFVRGEVAKVKGFESVVPPTYLCKTFAFRVVLRDGIADSSPTTGGGCRPDQRPAGTVTIGSWPQGIHDVSGSDVTVRLEQIGTGLWAYADVGGPDQTHRTEYRLFATGAMQPS